MSYSKNIAIEANIKIIAKEIFNMNAEDALTLHNYVFDAPYNHLDVDTIVNKYYIIFFY